MTAAAHTFALTDVCISNLSISGSKTRDNDKNRATFQFYLRLLDAYAEQFTEAQKEILWNRLSKIYLYSKATSGRLRNVNEPWMEAGVSDENTSVGHSPVFLPRKRVSRWVYFLKNRLFHKLFFQRRLRRKWMRIKGLPKEVAQNY